jgi:hypothetical protein
MQKTRSQSALAVQKRERAEKDLPCSAITAASTFSPRGSGDFLLSSDSRLGSCRFIRIAGRLMSVEWRRQRGYETMRTDHDLLDARQPEKQVRRPEMRALLSRQESYLKAGSKVTVNLERIWRCGRQ